MSDSQPSLHIPSSSRSMNTKTPQDLLLYIHARLTTICHRLDETGRPAQPPRLLSRPIDRFDVYNKLNELDMGIKRLIDTFVPKTDEDPQTKGHGVHENNFGPKPQRKTVEQVQTRTSRVIKRGLNEQGTDPEENRSDDVGDLSIDLAKSSNGKTRRRKPNRLSPMVEDDDYSRRNHIQHPSYSDKDISGVSRHVTGGLKRKASSDFEGTGPRSKHQLPPQTSNWEDTDKSLEVEIPSSSSLNLEAIDALQVDTNVAATHNTRICLVQKELGDSFTAVPIQRELEIPEFNPAGKAGILNKEKKNIADEAQETEIEDTEDDFIPPPNHNSRGNVVISLIDSEIDRHERGSVMEPRGYDINATARYEDGFIMASSPPTPKIRPDVEVLQSSQFHGQNADCREYRERSPGCRANGREENPRPRCMNDTRSARSNVEQSGILPDEHSPMIVESDDEHDPEFVPAHDTYPQRPPSIRRRTLRTRK